MRNLIMSPKLNRVMLTTRITVSVGWFGAVAVFIALAVTGIASANMQLARSSYIAMELSGWFVIVPFCIASLVIGIVQALGTKWGLLKHYWSVVKVILTLLATVALLLQIKPIGGLSLAASGNVDFTNALPDLKLQIVANAGAAFLLLLAIITISVFKPMGKTKWVDGSESSLASKQSAPNKSLRIYLILAVALLLVFISVKHLIGGGMGHH